jgi:hypothetical protein
MLLSSLVEIKNFPFGWKTKSVTQLSCPLNVSTQRPFLVSHSFIVLSRDPLATKSVITTSAVDFYIRTASGFSSTVSSSFFLRASRFALRSVFIYSILSLVLSFSRIGSPSFDSSYPSEMLCSVSVVPLVSKSWSMAWYYLLYSAFYIVTQASWGAHLRQSI